MNIAGLTLTGTAVFLLQVAAVTQIQPRLAEARLELEGERLTPAWTRETWRPSIHSEGLEITVEDRCLTASRDGKQVWQVATEGPDSYTWLTAAGGTAYLRMEKQPEKVTRLRIADGSWLEPLEPGVPGAGTTRSLIEVIACDDLVVCLTVVHEWDPARQSDPVVQGYEVTCYAAGSTEARWTRTTAAEGYREEPGAYLLASWGPDQANSRLQRLSWLGRNVLVCAEERQPLICLASTSGTELWRCERPWEFQRGFVGPSVWAHYLSRLGVHAWDAEEEKTLVAERRASFDERHEGWTVGGPYVIRLPFERDDDAYSIFLAIALAPRVNYRSYLADCLLLELQDEGEPVSMARLARMVTGNVVEPMPDGLVWRCQGDSFFRVAAARRAPVATMGPGGGADGISTILWSRQLDPPPAEAWLVSARAGDPVAFLEGHAFCLPDGGRVVSPGDREYCFPITAIELRTGLARDALLRVPFDGDLEPPSTNYSSTTRPDGSRSYRAFRPHGLAVTDLRVRGGCLEIILGTETGAGSVGFAASDLPLPRPPDPTRVEAARVQARIASLGDDLDVLDAHGNSPLLSAVAADDVPLVRGLLAAGASPDLTKDGGWTPLLVAAAHGSAEMVEALIQGEADVDAVDRHNGDQTTLHWAARSGRQSGAKVALLLAAGADHTARSAAGRNPLFSAAQDGAVEAVELLLAAGLSPTDRAASGATPLMVAARQPSVPVVTMLLDAGAEVDAVDEQGRTALMWAARGHSSGDVARALLAAGADPTRTDAEGRTALDLTSGNRSGSEAVARAIREALEGR